MYRVRETAGEQKGRLENEIAERKEAQERYILEIKEKYSSANTILSSILKDNVSLMTQIDRIAGAFRFLLNTRAEDTD